MPEPGAALIPLDAAGIALWDAASSKQVNNAAGTALLTIYLVTKCPNYSLSSRYDRDFRDGAESVPPPDPNRPPEIWPEQAKPRSWSVDDIETVEQMRLNGIS